MKKSLLLPALIAVASVSATQAQFSDNFNRANTAQTSDGSVIGSNWVIGSPVGSPQLWYIQSNALHKNTLQGDGAVSNSVIWNTTVNMANTGTITGSVTLNGTAGARGGLAFNVQDFDSFYQLRLQPTAGSSSEIQFVRVNNGSLENATSFTLTGTEDFSLGTAYTISVTNNNTSSNNISFSISGAGITTRVGTITDTTFTTGFGGFVAANFNATNADIYTFDNFTAVPEPSSLAMLLGGAVVVILMRRRASQKA